MIEASLVHNKFSIPIKLEYEIQMNIPESVKESL